MAMHVSPKWVRTVAGALAGAGMLIPVSADSSATYGYDELGQLRSARYDNGACVAYVYDPAGNRTSQSNTLGAETTWGASYWGCLTWTAP